MLGVGEGGHVEAKVMEPAVLRLRCYAAMAMMLRERYYDATAETMCGLGQGSVGW